MIHLTSNKYVIGISMLCISIMLLPTDQREVFYLNLSLASNGQYWRFLTGHITHYSWIHCISNLAGLYLLHVLFQQANTNTRWVLPTLFILCTISLGLVISSENLKWYVGYSGVLVGLLSYQCVNTFEQNALLSFGLLLASITYVSAQTMFEGELVQSTLFTGINTSSYAHMYGLVAGFIYGVFECVTRYSLDFNRP